MNKSSFELHFSQQTLFAGGHLAQSVIYVPGSYVPRSASLNLTAHLFGHSINFFEAGIRAEGMDHFVDKMVCLSVVK